jgi:hypothetical protein
MSDQNKNQIPQPSGGNVWGLLLILLVCVIAGVALVWRYFFAA